MKTLNIEVNDSVYEHILFFLQNLPKDMVKISKQIEPNQIVKLSTKEKVEELFKTKDIEPFKDIEDPIAWQKSMRDDHETLTVSRKNGDAFVVMSLEDYNREKETLYVLENSNLMKQIEASLFTYQAK